MKYKSLGSLLVIFLTMTFFNGDVASAKSVSYEPSKNYVYTYKMLNYKGKVIFTETYSVVKKGDMKGTWKLKGHDFYKSYGEYGLNMISGTYDEYQRGALSINNLLPSNNPKKGDKGRLENGISGTKKYKILSTNAKVKVKNKTYKNTIKIWTNYSGNTVQYYAPNIGLVKEQYFEEGEYKTLYYLAKRSK